MLKHVGSRAGAAVDDGDETGAEQKKKLEEKEGSYLFNAGMLDATNGIHMKELFATYISRFN